MAVSAKVASRISTQLKKYQRVLEAAKQRDISEADTVTIITDILSDALLYDKYKHGRTVQSRWLRPLPRRSCSLRLFVAPPFAQQLIILSWVVAFEAIECVVRRLNGGSADLLFDCVDVPGGLFQTAQRFLGQWLSLGQSDCHLRKPTTLFSIAPNLRTHPALDYHNTTTI